MNDTQRQIAEIEAAMARPDFWSDKIAAQETIARYNALKDELEGGNVLDRKHAIITIFGGAGGDDAEDFAYMLYSMYQKYCAKRGWGLYVLHDQTNDHGGIKSVTFEVEGKGSYGILAGESGVHRLVRISPFNASGKRHTSFAMVEVIPKIEKVTEVDLDMKDVRVELSKSGGPGGQNVNKRETAVRLIHEPTNISVHVSSERSQVQNKERAFALLAGKLFHFQEENRKKEAKGLSISSTVSAEWGNQIRSYVLHPYKLVKDHRTGVEVRQAEDVLNGDIDEFLKAEENIT